MSEDFGDLLVRLSEISKHAEPCVAIRVDREGRGLEVILDTSIPFNGEWIPGECGDVCLYRSRSDNKLVGAFFPLLNDKLSVWTDGPVKINEGFFKADSRMVPLRDFRNEVAATLSESKGDS